MLMLITIALDVREAVLEPVALQGVVEFLPDERRK